MTPIVKIYVSCCMLMFGSAFSVTMILSYLPFLVKFLLPHVAERNIGRYSGIIDASMFLGRIIGGFVWGRLADVWSRKNVFMWSAVGIALSCFLFGFSTNFFMAIITRFFVGLLNGIVGNAKASVSHYTKQSRRALGMSVIICFWAAGFVAGQAISGAVADPVDQYDLPSNAFLEKYPYCLPAIVCALINVCAAITTLCVFPDDGPCTKERAISNQQQNSSTDNEQLQTESTDNELIPCVEHHVRSHDAVVADNTEISISGISYRQLLQREDENDRVLGNESLDDKCEASETEPEAKSTKIFDTKKQGMAIRTRNACLSTLRVTIGILRDKVSFAVLINYTLLSVVVMGFDETYPLWAANSPELGGLGFSVRKIATSQAVIGVALLPFTLLYFPSLEKCFGTTMAFIINCLLASVCSILLPSLTYVSSSPALLWSLLLTLLLIIRVSIVACLTAGSLLINNAATADKLGTMNGISLTMLSAGRAIAPVMMGTIYSFSLSPNNERIGFPVDFHLTFIVNSALLTGCVVIAAFYPKSLDKSRQAITSVTESNQ